MSKIYYKGLQPDPTDFRDYMLGDYLPPDPLGMILPLTHEVIPMSPIRDQGHHGICVGEACSGLKDCQERRQGKLSFLSSPLFIYNECKKVDGLAGQGTYLRTAMKVLAEIGTVEESCCPYKGSLKVKSCDGWNVQAAKYRIKTYAKVSPDPYEAMKALITFGPICAGVYTSGSWSRTSTGDISDMTDNRSRKGGHAILIIGFNQTTKRFTFRNSWGERWGNKGYGTISFKYYEEQCLSAWSTVDI